MKYSKKILANGLTVLEVPSHDAESVVVDFFVKTGSRSESAKENGISHFLEHFLFKGTKKYPSALAITELIDSIGGEMNANTGKEHTQYYIKAKSSHLPLIFEVLTDMLQNPLLDNEELQREKGVIVEEINMYKDLPMAEIDNVLEGTMWPQDRLGQGIAGSKSTVTKFTTEMFKDYMNRHYQVPNMVLGVAGKYNPKELKALVKQYWGAWPRKKFHGFQKVADKQGRSRVSIQYKDTEQAHLVLGFKGLNHRDKRNATASILSTILGSGMSSRLFTEVRERRGLAYYVRASSGNYHDTGVFSISSGVQVNKVDEAITVILKELKKIKEISVDSKELKKAKEYIKGKSTLALEDNHMRLDWYLEQIAFDQKVQTPQEFFDEIDTITSKQVQKLARELFVMKHLTLAIIGPYKSEKHFTKLLKF